MPFSFAQIGRDKREKSQRRKQRKRDRRQERRSRERELLQPAQPNEALGGILEERFEPEFERLQGAQPGLEQSLIDRINAPIDFEAFRGQLSALAESVTGELFGAGGAVEQAQIGARGRTVETGFGTTSGGLTNATQNIFLGARDRVANVVGQGAIQLSGQAVQQRGIDIGALGEFTQFQGSRTDELRESLFGGQATIEQLRLAEEQLKDNRRLLNESLGQGGKGFGSRIGGAASGAASGAAIGSIIPGFGTVAGGIVGGVAGFFG